MKRSDPQARLGPLGDRAMAPARGPVKVTTLDRAVRGHVRPGDHVHLVSGLTRPAALVYELLRRYAGRPSPKLTVSAMTLAGPHTLLAHTGIVRHLIACFHGDTLPTPGPNPLLQEAHSSGRLTISEWSILSFTQRLQAAALGLPWTPTQSLTGSSMAQQPEVRTIDGTTVVEALVPDVAFVHAAAADRYGNVLLGAPFGDAGLGAWAARRGAVVTVERIVEPDVVAAHPLNMRLPSAVVAAVAEVPLGAHPGPLFCGGIEDVVAPLAEDVEFVAEFREACRDAESLDVWTKSWIFDGGHDAYVARLGAARAARLRGRAQLASWREDAVESSGRIFRDDLATPGERAVVAGGRALAQRMKERGLQTVLAGVGMSNLAAWLARTQLAAEDFPVSLMVELGLYGYVPPPGDPLLVSNRTAATATGLGGVLDILGLGLAATESAGIVGAGQVDRRANLNSTFGTDGRLLVGSGGVNDVASCCRDVVVVALQSKQRFVDEVSYITAPGGRVSAVATQYGLLQKDESGELVLASVFGPVSEGVARAKAACGWDLRTAGRVGRLRDPSRDEIETVRGFDPKGDYTG